MKIHSLSPEVWTRILDLIQSFMDPDGREEGGVPPRELASFMEKDGTRGDPQFIRLQFPFTTNQQVSVMI